MAFVILKTNDQDDLDRVLAVFLDQDEASKFLDICKKIEAWLIENMDKLHDHSSLYYKNKDKINRPYSPLFAASKLSIDDWIEKEFIPYQKAELEYQKLKIKGDEDYNNELKKFWDENIKPSFPKEHQSVLNVINPEYSSLEYPGTYFYYQMYYKIVEVPLVLKPPLNVLGE